MSTQRANVLDRPSTADEMLVALSACFTPDVAHRILEIGLNPEQQARLDELESKSQQGTLTQAEQREYDWFRGELKILDRVKALCRMALEGAAA